MEPISTCELIAVVSCALLVVCADWLIQTAVIRELILSHHVESLRRIAAVQSLSTEKKKAIQREIADLVASRSPAGKPQEEDSRNL